MLSDENSLAAKVEQIQSHGQRSGMDSETPTPGLGPVAHKKLSTQLTFGTGDGSAGLAGGNMDKELGVMMGRSQEPPTPIRKVVTNESPAQPNS